MLSEYDIIVRMVVAAILGGMIGLEREMHDQPAGLRTHIILVLGATAAMCISINLSMQFHTAAANGDPERLAAQVISGIGFLGAGAIFRYGAGVKGLTTATSLWTTAIIGLAVGANYFIVALVASLCVLFTLIALDIMEKKYLRTRTTRTIFVRGSDRPGFVEAVKGVMSNFGISVKSVCLSKNLASNEIEVESIAKVFFDQDLDDLVSAICKVDGVSDFRIR